VVVADVQRSAAEVQQQLSSAEIVRCKFSQAQKKAEAKELAIEMAEMTGAAVAEVIGHTALLYRPSDSRLLPLE
jgi:RNA-binding protein YhbY